MMRRATLHAQLSDAVRQASLILVTGLPKVGRTVLLKSWSGEQPRSKLCAGVGELEQVDGVFLLDHVGHSAIEPIIAFVRGVESSRISAPVIAAPEDLSVAQRLTDALPGSVRLIEVIPLQLGDVESGGVSEQVAHGPFEGTLEPSPPSNFAPALDALRWLRGGLPPSLMAESDRESFEWRRRMLGALLGRDYGRWGLSPTFSLEGALRWIANRNGGEFDENDTKPFGKQEIRSAIYVLERLGLVRRLYNYPAGSTASMNKMPKLLIRDTGLLHAVLGVETQEQLRRHDDIGESFESYAIEALIQVGGAHCEAQFYRTGGSNANEIDLVLEDARQRDRRMAIEIKVDPDARPRPGFFRGYEALSISDRFLVHSGSHSTLQGEVHRLDLRSAIARVTDFVRNV